LPLALLLAACAAAPSVSAQEASVSPETRKECGACHPVFPAEALTARQWDALMRRLGHHFGEDASLPREVRSRIRADLMEKAAADPGGTPTAWVSESAWWKRKHRDVPAEKMRLRTGINLDNCVACHELSSYETADRPTP